MTFGIEICSCRGFTGDVKDQDYGRLTTWYSIIMVSTGYVRPNLDVDIGYWKYENLVSAGRTETDIGAVV